MGIIALPIDCWSQRGRSLTERAPTRPTYQHHRFAIAGPFELASFIPATQDTNIVQPVNFSATTGDTDQRESVGQAWLLNERNVFSTMATSDGRIELGFGHIGGVAKVVGIRLA